MIFLTLPNSPETSCGLEKGFKDIFSRDDEVRSISNHPITGLAGVHVKRNSKKLSVT
jgi:hypothetical protein